MYYRSVFFINPEGYKMAKIPFITKEKAEEIAESVVEKAEETVSELKEELENRE